MKRELACTALFLAIQACSHSEGLESRRNTGIDAGPDGSPDPSPGPIPVKRDAAIDADPGPGPGPLRDAEPLSDVDPPPIDADCDELTDESVTNPCGGCTTLTSMPGAACTQGTGACAASGKYVCDGPDSVRCDAAKIQAAPETCDGIDNDCDGTVDDEANCSAPVGGSAACVGGQCMARCDSSDHVMVAGACTPRDPCMGVSSCSPGTCTPSGRSFVCACPAGFTGSGTSSCIRSCADFSGEWVRPFDQLMLRVEQAECTISAVVTSDVPPDHHEINLTASGDSAVGTTQRTMSGCTTSLHTAWTRQSPNQFKGVAQGGGCGLASNYMEDLAYQRFRED